MSNRNIGLTQALDSTARDDEQITVTLTFRDLKLIVGQTRASIRYTEKQDAKYVRKHGQAFAPEPGKHSITEVARMKLGNLERKLCAAAGIVSMFDGDATGK